MRRPIALATLIIALCVSIFLRTARTTFNYGCGYDGQFYCRMLNGDLVPAPYNRRVLTVGLAWPLHQLNLTTGTAFLVVDLMALTVSAVLVWVLVDRLASQFGALKPEITLAAVAAAGVVLLNPATLRTALAAPVVTDDVGLAALLLALTVMTGQRPLLTAPLAFVATLAREANAAPLLVGALALLVGADKRIRLVVMTSVIAVAAGAAIALQRPHLEGSYGTVSQIRTILDMHLSRKGATSLVWNAVSGLTFLVFVIFTHRRRLLHNWKKIRVLLAAGIANAGMALIGGYDTARLLLPTAVIITIIALASAAAWSKTRMPAVLLFLSILLWRPLDFVGSNFFEQLVPFLSPQQLAGSSRVITRAISDLLLLVAGVTGLAIFYAIEKLCRQVAKSPSVFGTRSRTMTLECDPLPRCGDFR